MPSPFTPLMDTNNPIQPMPLYTPRDTPSPTIDTGNTNQAKQLNSVTTPAADSIEADLKAAGSETSTLSIIAAWLGAAKGDFRGLQAIEDSKRRTALAKSIIPEINKVNTMTNAGKWEEASDYVNKLTGSYGSRADYLVPYFTQMQAQINKKQEGWQNLKGLYEGIKDQVPEGHVNYPVVEFLRKAVESRTPMSETNLQGFMTRYGTPHIQNLNNRITATSPLTLKTQTDQLPTVIQGSDMDNFAGITVAAGNNLNTKQLADLHNGLPVKTSTGQTIQPNSEKAQAIKTQFNALQPINAQLEMAKLVNIPPEAAIQLLKDNGLLKTAIRSFGEGTIDEALKQVRQQETQKQIAIIKGTEAEKTITPNEGFVVHGDESDPDTFLSIRPQPTTINEVTGSKGKLLLIPPTVMPVIQQTQAAIQGLDTVTEMLKQGTKLQTTGDKLAQGVLQRLSSYIGYPVEANTETRQVIKTILNTAIEQMENTALLAPSQVRGGDRKDIADLKVFASGDFKSEKEVLTAVERTRARLANMTKMLIGKSPPVTQPEIPRTERTPVEILSPAITKGQKGKQPTQSQITRDPYGPGGIQIPVDIEEGIKRAVQATGKAAKESNKPTGGAVRVEIPDTAKGKPTLSETPKGYSEEDEVAKAIAAKRMQRIR